MITQAEEQFEFINMVANRLAQKFTDSLFISSIEKTYAMHVGRLAEILDWSQEFYEQYHDKIDNWKCLNRAAITSNNAVTLDDLIVAFGRERLKKFYTKNANLATFFRERYSSIRI